MLNSDMTHGLVMDFMKNLSVALVLISVITLSISGSSLKPTIDINNPIKV
ncbi:MAG: hypothetical protein ACM3UN_04065 [Bacillota bacterium]